MKTDRRLSRVVIFSLLSAAFIAVRPAQSQSVVSTFTLPVSGTISAAKSGLNESVTLSGSVLVTARVVTDPALGPGAVVSIDGRGVKGIGNKTQTVYLNECEARLTRPFAATDVIKLTFAFFQNAPGSYLTSKTGLLTLTLTYDTVTMKLTNVTGSAGAF